METLLQAVLNDRLALPEALQWALGSEGPPPIHLNAPEDEGSPWERLTGPGGRPLNCCTPAAFRVYVLNHVREAAELILAAAEQDGMPSNPPTPERGSGDERSGGGTGPAGSATERRVAATLAASLPAPRLQPQPRVTPKLMQPGMLDDANFPALGVGPPARERPQPRASPTGKGSKVGLGIRCCQHLALHICCGLGAAMASEDH